jgi:GNAT superfamily N-acetyltransferase
MSQPSPVPALCWRIQPVTHEATNQVVSFIKEARRATFPELCAQRDDDITRYIQSGRFLYATDQTTAAAEEEEGKEDAEAEEIIAIIGYVPYHHRWTHFAPYSDGRRTVEVVRLFVLPRYRRYGLASALVRELKRQAVEDGVARLYLHTHPFLPGAIAFWEKHGFGVMCVEEEDGVWRTTHMEVLIEKEEEEEEEGYRGTV